MAATRKITELILMDLERATETLNGPFCHQTARGLHTNIRPKLNKRRQNYSMTAIVSWIMAVVSYTEQGVHLPYNV